MTQKPAHTAGPWTLDGYNLSTVLHCTCPKGHPSARHLSGDYEVIARCEGPNWEANASLIAAAPDLHSVAAEISAWEERWPVHRIYTEETTRKIAAEMTAIVERARAALAKAEGR